MHYHSLSINPELQCQMHLLREFSQKMKLECISFINHKRHLFGKNDPCSYTINHEHQQSLMDFESVPHTAKPGACVSGFQNCAKGAL